MPTVLLALPGLTLGELVHLATSYCMFLELHMRWGQDSGDWLGGQTSRPSASSESVL